MENAFSTLLKFQLAYCFFHISSLLEENRAVDRITQTSQHVLLGQLFTGSLNSIVPPPPPLQSALLTLYSLGCHCHCIRAARRYLPHLCRYFEKDMTRKEKLRLSSCLVHECCNKVDENFSLQKEEIYLAALILSLAGYKTQ